MTEFLTISNAFLTFIAMLSAMAIGALSVWLLRRRWALPKQTLWQLVVSYAGGILVGGILALLFAVLAPSILGGVSLWVLPAMLIGMVVGALIVPMLPLPSGWSWQTAGCGLWLIFLGGCTLGGGAFILGGGGVHGAPEVIPGEDDEPFFDEQFVTFTPTPTTARPSATPTTAKPSATPTPTTASPGATPTPTTASPGATPTPTATFTVTPTATATVPTLPANFDITLSFTNSNCGYDNFQSPFNFNIQNSTLTITQLNAANVTSGPYNPPTGAASTSGSVAGGQETYNIVITFDGTIITVAGVNAFTGPGMPLPTCAHDVFGQAPVP